MYNNVREETRECHEAGVCVMRRFATYVIVLVAVFISRNAAAQNAGDFMNMFSGMMRAAISEHARTEWSKLSPNETSCVEQGLRQQGYSIDRLVQNGIAPQDPRVSGIRSGCRVSPASLPSPNESIGNIGNISATPTFDCTKARTPTARIICLDQTGAKADWDLTSAFWARYFTLVESARDGFSQAEDNWFPSLNRPCQLQPTQDTFSDTQRQCVLAAYARRAALFRSQLNGDALYKSQLTPEQHAQIQAELIRRGLLNDAADGEFGQNTRNAIKAFQEQAGLSNSEFMTAQQLQQLLHAGSSPGPIPLSSSELSNRASNLSSDQAVGQCQSGDAEKRLLGCTAIIDKRSRGFGTTISLADALEGRCWAYNDLGQFGVGLQDCNAAIAINPDRPYAYNTLGNSLLGLGNVTQAIAAFTKSIELKPNFAYSHLGRARAFVAAGNTDMARKDFDFVLTIDPANQAAKDGRSALDNPTVVAEPAGPGTPTPTPPKETAPLKEARAFLEDAKRFIAEQREVPSISTIAKEAANLQIALDKFDEAAAIQSMQKLGDLLKPIAGFSDYEQQQQGVRKREEARQLAEARTEGNRNIFFVDSYMKNHLGDPKTASLITLREQINDSIKGNIEQISRANNAFLSYVSGNGLSDLYEAITKEFSNPTVPQNGNLQTLAERLGIGEKSKFVVEGPLDDVVLLYNISQKAPKVWKNVEGDVVFQDDAASLCFAQANPEITVVRYIEHILGDHGVKHLTSAQAQCDLSRAASSIDIIAFQRGELLKAREDYILTLVKMIEGDSFREYLIITDYPSVFQKRRVFSREIESDVANNNRNGFGVIAVSESSVACVVSPEVSRAERWN